MKVDIPIYLIDTDDSIRLRISVKAQDLPQNISFTQLTPGVYEVESLKSDILADVTEGNVIFSEFYNTIKDKYPHVSIYSIAETWLILNSYITKEFISIIQGDINQLKSTKPIDVDHILLNKRDLQIKFNNEYKRNVFALKKQDDFFIQFQNKEEVPYTKFELKKIIKNIKFDTKDISLDEIFNRITIDSVVCFASFSDYYKIYSKLIPNQDKFISWSITSPSIIFIKISIDENIYSTAVLWKDEEEYLNLQITEEIKMRKNILNILKDAIKPLKNINELSNVQSFIKGRYSFKNQSTNKYIFNDFITNNNLISKYFYTDESIKANKKKKGLYVYFTENNIDILTFNIFSEDDDVTVKITKAKDEALVTRFQSIFSKVFKFYLEERTGISNIYKKYIPDFEPEKKITKPKKTTPGYSKELEELVPDLFVAEYTRRCTKPPSVIDESEVNKWKANGYEVMKFPKKGDTHYYVCNNNSEYKYPGLRKNPLRNKDKYPLLPCCYKNSHSDRTSSLYYKYLHEDEEEYEEDEKYKRIQRYVFKSNKFLHYGIYGALPVEIQKTLDILYPSDRNTFLRKGVIRGKNSFLECVLEATSIYFSSLTDTHEREAELSKVRKELENFQYLSICRQELYDYDVESIRKYLADPEKYLDPKLFLRLLEYKYNCEIYIFYRTACGDIFLEIPRHRGNYIKYNNPTINNAILIFEHTGSESDAATYPQCELITRKKNVYENKDSPLFSKSNISKLFSTVNLSYFLKTKVKEKELSNAFSFTSQYIDSYGKTRILEMKNNDKNIYIYTDPLPPLNIPEMDKNKVSKVSLDDIPNISIIGQGLHNNKVVEVEILIGPDVKGIIPITPRSKLLPSIPTFNASILSMIDNFSLLSDFKKNKKDSEILKEFFIMLFSRFINDNNINEPQPQDYKNFVDKYVIIIENYKYINKDYFWKQDIEKLVVPSIEALKRLLYLLRLEWLRNKEGIIAYKYRASLKFTYSDITSFTEDDSWIILSGDESFKVWLKGYYSSFILSKRINPDTDIPYFFENNKLSNDLYLAQNCLNLKQAKYISQTWDTKGYNPRDFLNKKEDLNPSFLLASYKSEDDIKKYKIKGNTEKEYIIAGYKSDDIPGFTSLLPI